MKYVYILESLNSRTFLHRRSPHDLQARFAKHNAGEVPAYIEIQTLADTTYIAFSDEQLAIAFEKYLKSGSGRAFAKKHF